MVWEGGYDVLSRTVIKYYAVFVINSLSTDEKSAVEQRAKKIEQTINLSTISNKLNCTQFSKDSRVFLDFFPMRRRL